MNKVIQAVFLEESTNHSSSLLRSDHSIFGFSLPLLSSLAFLLRRTLFGITLHFDFDDFLLLRRSLLVDSSLILRSSRSGRIVLFRSRSSVDRLLLSSSRGLGRNEFGRRLAADFLLLLLVSLRFRLQYDRIESVTHTSRRIKRV